MYTEFSHYFLLLAIYTAFTLVCLQNRSIIDLRILHKNIFWMISLYSIIFTSSLFGTLTSYASSDFSVYNILTNCSLRSPLFYKISATWSNHEGSLLLWCWLLSFYGFLFCIMTRNAMRRWSDSYIEADHFVTFLSKVRRTEPLLRSSRWRDLLLRNLCFATTDAASKNRASLYHRHASEQRSEGCEAKWGKVRSKEPQRSSTPPLYHVPAASYFVPLQRSLARLLSGPLESAGSKKKHRNQLRSIVVPHFASQSKKKCIFQTCKRLSSLSSLSTLVRSSQRTCAYNSLTRPLLRNLCSAPLPRPIVEPKEFDLLLSHLLCLHRNKLFIKQQQGRVSGAELVFSFIILFFATFLVYTSNPFLKVTFPCINSLAELNPVLQDPVLAIHPPCIYAGYVASALSFSLCLSKINYDCCARAQQTFEERSKRGRFVLLLRNLCCATPTAAHLSDSFANATLTKLKQLSACAGRSAGASANVRSKSAPLWPVDAQLRKLQRTLQFRRKAKNVLRTLLLCCATFAAQPMRDLVFNSSNVRLRSNICFATWPQVRFWILACWSFLTIGILLGSWWAYHELGWGGWWFWDPVENASLMPWLLATACIHSAAKRRFVAATLYLSLSAFLLSILGTFFVRSGLLASVHSFATDSTRGLYLLLFLLSITAISVFKYIQFQRSKKKQVILKTQIEQILSLQNLFFCVICTVVLCGTSAPIFFQWFCNRDVSTGAPFYNGTLIPLFTSVLFVLVYTHYTQLTYFSNQQKSSASHDVKATATKAALVLSERAQQKRSKKLIRTWRNLSNEPLLFFEPLLSGEPFFYCILFCVLFHFICLNLLGLSFLDSIYGTICFLLICSFILSKNMICLDGATYEHPRMRSLQPSRLISLLVLSRAQQTLSMKIAHIGIVLFITGIIISNTFKVQFTQLMHYGDLIRLGPQICCLRGIDHAYAPTFHSICGNLLCCALAGATASYGTYEGCEAKDRKQLSYTYRTFLSFAAQPRAQVEPSEAAHDLTHVLNIYEPPKNSNLAQQHSLCMFPEKRFFFSNQELTTSKVAIHTNLFTDYYGLIGTGSFEGGWFTTIMKMPFIFCIWLGFLLATIGGALALKRQLQKSKLIWV